MVNFDFFLAGAELSQAQVKLEVIVEVVLEVRIKFLSLSYLFYLRGYWHNCCTLSDGWVVGWVGWWEG